MADLLASSPPLVDVIAGDEPLWRLLHSSWVVSSDSGGADRVSSAAFKDRTSERRDVSVFRLRLMRQEFRNAHAERFPKAAEILCCTVTALGHAVEPDTKDGQDVSHAVIIPPDVKSGPWARNAAALADAATIVNVAAPP